MEKNSTEPKSNPLSFFNYLKGDGSFSDSDEEADDKDARGQDEKHNPFSFKSFASDPPLHKSPSRGSLPRDRESPAPPEPPPELPDLPPANLPCAECVQLRKENRRFRSQLQESDGNVAALNKKIAKLTKQLKMREERETAEASQLEEMLHQVEKNLQLSQARAQKAEEAAAKLSREVIQLRAMARNPDEPSRSAEVGTELVEASKNAKLLLRQLLAGVDRASVLGQTLQSEAKFREVP